MGEVSGKKVSSIAGKWLRVIQGIPRWKRSGSSVELVELDGACRIHMKMGTIEELEAVLASVLTQSPDKKK